MLPGEPEHPAVDDRPPDEMPVIYPPPSNPMAVARQFLEDAGLNHRNALRVRWWRGSYQFWSLTHWTEIADPAVRAMIYSRLEHVQYRKWNPKTEKEELAGWNPNRGKVADTLQALQAIVHLGEQVEPPSWMDGTPSTSLAMENGLLDLTDRTMEEHSPQFFNQFSLPYSFQPNASYPARWRAFLAELWPDDDEAISLLQEFFGYVLSGATNLHKILLLVGRPRSGKGTIARVLTALLGKANVAGPTLSSIGTNFGLSPLLGKPLAIISDARLGGPDTRFVVVERLLSISGEDAITVDRKYREPWTGRLPTRFMVISNELPNLGDASGAVATRFLVLTLTQSWLGRENENLTNELLTELPAILNWALEGLDRLQKARRFVEPASSRDAVTTLTDLTSPVSAFVREVCVQGAGFEVSCRVLYMRWRAWSMDHGRDHPTTDAVFGRDLRAVLPTLKRARRGEGHTWVYEGIDIAREGFNGPDLGPSGTDGAEDGPVPDGPRSDPMKSLPDVWRCDGCGVERSDDMTGFACKCGGHFQELTS
jgi:putative DNA primase/helicase